MDISNITTDLWTLFSFICFHHKFHSDHFQTLLGYAGMSIMLIIMLPSLRIRYGSAFEFPTLLTCSLFDNVCFSFYAATEISCKFTRSFPLFKGIK